MNVSFLGSGRRLNPTRMILLGFAAVIALGTLLLRLPIASRGEGCADWLTCLFTATSATCVTGLVRVDTMLGWTGFGQVVILLLLQLGGLGFVTVLSLLWLARRERIGLSQRLMMASALNLPGPAGVVRVVRHALWGTALVEITGALFLSTRFVPRFGWGQGIWFSIFHSVSAFCNGGFDLMGAYTGAYSSLEGFQGDPVVLLTLSALIVVGGLGFFVWEDFLEKRSWRRMSFYSKLAIAITAGLILLGTLSFLALEWNNPDTLGEMSGGEKVLNALFQSVTLRTAGFASFDQGALRDNSAVLSSLLMLVGGCSGSTAGGVKTVTAGVMLLTMWGRLRGREQIVLRGRTLPEHRVLDALTLVMTVGALLLAGSMTLTLTDGLPFLTAFYETASALGTAGLSMGATPGLSTAGALLIVLFMYLGRVGILSFSIAFLTRHSDGKLHYPRADILIG